MIMVGPKPATHSPTVAEQYEVLRAAVLGQAPPPDSRSGLSVFLNRGMWTWVRMIVVDPIRQSPIPASTVRASDLDRTCERRAVIHLLAAMAMTITDRRPP
jgi:hypothetical protein